MAVVKAISTQELAALANRLRLTLIRDRMEEMLTMAVDKKLSPRETLEFFFRQEIRRREENRIRQGIMGAHFPAVRTLEDFDFEAQPSIDVKQIKELAQLEWIGQAKNVLFLGPPGVGKTHLAIALGREAIKLGMSVAFYSAEELGSLLDRGLVWAKINMSFPVANTAGLFSVKATHGTPHTIPHRKRRCRPPEKSPRIRKAKWWCIKSTDNSERKTPTATIPVRRVAE